MIMGPSWGSREYDDNYVTSSCSNQTKENEMDASLVSTKEYVECELCKKAFPVSGDGYFVLYGHLGLSSGGGVIGAPLGEDNLVSKASVFCPKCLFETIKKAGLWDHYQQVSTRTSK